MAKDADEGATDSPLTDRRRFVQGAAALGAAGLAGCYHVPRDELITPSQGKDLQPTLEQEDVDPVHGWPLAYTLIEGGFHAEGDGDRTLRINAGSGPKAKNANWSIWADQEALDLLYGGGLLFLDLGAFNRVTGDVNYYLLEEVTGGRDYIDMKIRDGIKWHNGEPYTAKDFWAANHLNYISNRFFNNKEYLPNPLEGEPYLELREDENMMRLHLKEPRRARFFSQEFLIGGFGTRSARYTYDQISEYVHRIQDAVADGDEEQLVKIHEDFLGAGRRDAFRLSDEDVLFHGPFKLKERQNNGVLLEPNPHFPREEFIDPEETALNFETIKGRRIRNDQAKWKAMVDAEIQLETNEFPAILARKRPEKIKFTSYETWRGVGMQFDHTHVDFQHRPVRRAMAWALGQEQIMKNEGQVWRSMAGRPDGIRVNDSKWLEEYNGVLKDYSPATSNYEKAAAKLREAGYTKEDGEWYRPNGDRFKFKWLVRGRQLSVVKTAKQQLQDFGVGVNQLTSSFSSFPDEIDTKDWGAVLNWVWMFRPHPWFAYNHTFVSEWIPRQMSYAGWHPDNGRTGEGGIDQSEPGEFVVEVPPIGEWDGEPREVNVKDIHTKIGDPTADIDEKEGIQRLAWIYNYDLPKIPILTQRQGKFYNTKGKDGDWFVKGKENVDRRTVTRTLTGRATETANRTTTETTPTTSGN